jgi:hypothetical protein
MKQEAAFSERVRNHFTLVFEGRYVRLVPASVDSVNSEPGTDSQARAAHSFVNQMSGGRHPQWLAEGIAQVRPEEPGRPLAAPTASLAVQ